MSQSGDSKVEEEKVGHSISIHYLLRIVSHIYEVVSMKDVGVDYLSNNITAMVRHANETYGERRSPTVFLCEQVNLS